jgi:hypothetical protein
MVRRLVLSLCLLPTLASAAITDWVCTRTGTALGIPYYMAFGTCSTVAGGSATAAGDALANSAAANMSGLAQVLCGSGALTVKTILTSPLTGAASPNTTVFAIPYYDVTAFKLQILGGNVANAALLPETGTAVGANSSFSYMALCQ